MVKKTLGRQKRTKARDKKPTKQTTLSAVSSLTLPAKHSTGSVIIDFSLSWARQFVKLGDDNAALHQAKEQCRRQWDLIHPVVGSSMQEREALSRKRFQKEVWSYVRWGIKRFLSFKNAQGLYVPSSPASAIRHWDSVNADAALRPRPRPRPIRRYIDPVDPQPALLVPNDGPKTPIMAPADLHASVVTTPQTDSPPTSAYQTPLSSPVGAALLMSKSPVCFVRAPSHRLQPARLARKTHAKSPRIKVEYETPKLRLPPRVKQARLSPWPFKTHRIKKES
ncbi:hypothetical protein CYLTODRAFT_460348, partial [Cylindrobasidium torrendii FP15055 ss-10]